MSATSALFSPLRIGGLTLVNCIAVSPMRQYTANDGEASACHLTHLAAHGHAQKHEK